MQQLSQKVGAQSKSVEDTAVFMRNLLQLEELNKNFGNVQADIIKWKSNEEQFIGEEFMETETPGTGNPVPVTSTSEIAPHEIINLIFGETSETQPVLPISTNPFIPIVSYSTIRVNATPSNFVRGLSESELRHPESDISFSDSLIRSDV